MSKARGLADLGNAYSDGALSNRNLIINGGFDVWQRSVSNLSVSANTYPAADRWKFWNGGAVTGSTRTEFPAGQTGVSNLDYYNSISIGANSASADYSLFAQHIDNVKVSNQQTFTVSFYAKASQSWTIALEPVQNFGTGGSTRVLGTAETVTVGTAWSRHTVTFSTAGISGKTLGDGHNFELVFWLTSGGDASSRARGIGNQAGTFDITGVQLEVGDTATPFEHRSDELQRCQRYYRQMEIRIGCLPWANSNGGWQGESRSFDPVMRASPAVTQMITPTYSGSITTVPDSITSSSSSVIVNTATTADRVLIMNNTSQGTIFAVVTNNAYDAEL
jgi:hypothetical protein